MTKHTLLRGTKAEILEYFNQDLKILDRQNAKNYEVGKNYDLSTQDRDMRICHQLSLIDTEISPFSILFYLHCDKILDDGTINVITEKLYVYITK